MASTQPKPKADYFDVRDYSDMRCPMHGLLNLLTGPWTAYILWLLRTHGAMRFGQIRKQLPSISAKVLTERLRMLERAGILSRYQEACIPPRVTYSFTQRGHELDRLLDQINQLALSWTDDAQQLDEGLAHEAGPQSPAVRATST